MIVFSYAFDILFSAIFLLALRSKVTNVMNFRYEIISYGVVAACSVLISEAFLVLCIATGLVLKWGIALAILLLGYSPLKL
jgi:hypothetical protein